MPEDAMPGKSPKNPAIEIHRPMRSLTLGAATYSVSSIFGGKQTQISLTTPLTTREWRGPLASLFNRQGLDAPGSHHRHFAAIYNPPRHQLLFLRFVAPLESETRSSGRNRRTERVNLSAHAPASIDAEWLKDAELVLLEQAPDRPAALPLEIEIPSAPSSR